MDASVKIAKQRLSVLELAEQLGNVTEACRRRGMDRTSFYEWKRRFQTHGLEGLKDLPPIHKSHPQAVKPENVTIQKILIEHGLGSRYDRWLALERKSAESGIGLTAEQVAYIEKLNPSFKERHVESAGPG